MAGFTCLGATAAPDECPDGYYQDEVGATDCKSCPAGLYCIFQCQVAELIFKFAKA